MALVMMKKLVTFPKKEVLSPKKTRSNNNVIKIDKNTNLLEALVKGGYITSHKAEDGKVKMRILVNKHDLKQLLETMNNDNDGSSKVLLPKASPLPEVERRLRDLMKRKRATNAKGRQSSNWRPSLQSIPEEH